MFPYSQITNYDILNFNKLNNKLNFDETDNKNMNVFSNEKNYEFDPQINYYSNSEKLNNFGIKFINHFIGFSQIDSTQLEKFTNEFILFNFQFTSDLSDLIKNQKMDKTKLYKLKNIIEPEIQNVLNFKNFIMLTDDYYDLNEVLEISIEFLEFVNDYLILIEFINLNVINGEESDEVFYESKFVKEEVKKFIKNNLTTLAIFDVFDSFINENQSLFSKLSLEKNIVKNIEDVANEKDLEKFSKNVHSKILTYFNYFSRSKSIREIMSEIYKNLEKLLINFVENEEIEIPDELE